MATTYDLLSAPTSQNTRLHRQRTFPSGSEGYSIQNQINEGIVIREILGPLQSLIVTADYQLLLGDYFDLQGLLVIEGTVLYV